MPIKDNDSDLQAKYKLVVAAVDRNVRKNIIIYFGIFVIIELYDSYRGMKQSEIIEKMTTTVAESYRGVVGLTTDGRVINIDKTQVDAENLKAIILRTLRDNFIVSRKELTKNYSVSNLQTEEDVLRNSPRLQAAFDDYIWLGDPATLSPEDLAFQKESTQYFMSYIGWLLINFNTNNLPHFITITDAVTTDFKPDKNKFGIRLQLPCQTQSVDNAGRQIDQYGVSEIYAEGMFDITKRTATNPFGLKIILKDMKIVQIHQNAGDGYQVQTK